MSEQTGSEQTLAELKAERDRLAELLDDVAGDLYLYSIGELELPQFAEALRDTVLAGYAVTKKAAA